MIPKKIHYCWFGYGEKPRLARKCIASWKKNCPDYQIIEWNEDNFDIDMNEYTRMCIEQKKYAFLSDYVRLVIIEKEGGIYFDTDVEVLRSFDIFLNYHAFFGFEDDQHINTGLGFGAEAGNGIVKAMLSEYDRLLDGSNGFIGCPILNTDALVKYGLILNGKRQQVKGAQIFPAEYFNPYDDPTGKLNRTRKTYSIHWYAKSWMSKKSIIRSTLTKPLHRVLGKDFYRNIRDIIYGNKSSYQMERNSKDKRRILIFSHAMELGGAERALLGLLEAIDYENYAVDLFLMRHAGELMEFIPEQVHLLPEIAQYTCLGVPKNEVFEKKQYAVALCRGIGKMKGKKTIQRLHLSSDNQVQIEYSHKYTKIVMPPVSRQEYDLAISFLTPHYFVAEKVIAKKKAAWIHTDYGKIDIDTNSELKMWSRYDYIVSISEDVSRQFLKKFPLLNDKLTVIHNMIPAKSILQQADAFSVIEEMPDKGEIKLLSIGRFCYAKNFDNVPYICKRIREQGLPVHWYLVGYGKEKEILNQIKAADMQDYVTILGKKKNPYPYIKACDYYIQPSRYEGYSVSVKEAQLLCRPVIITDYPTAKSQVRDGIDGMIIPLDNDSCADEICKIISDEKVRDRLIENCSKGDFSNKEEIGILWSLID